VEAGFSAGHVSSDGGSLLLREVDGRINLLARLAGCFRDGREPEQVEHPVAEMLSQRIYGLALGYEDLNDHERLRSDPIDRLLVELYIESHTAMPERIVLDLDATDIPLYGHQPERFFHRGPQGQVFVRGVARLLRWLLLSAAVHLRRRSAVVRAPSSRQSGCGLGLARRSEAHRRATA
jgi:Transposase DDE domain group 1